MRNPKLEIRNKPEIQRRNARNGGFVSDISLGALNLFRISSFVLRISRARGRYGHFLQDS
jgi:hypothetical protein